MTFDGILAALPDTSMMKSTMRSVVEKAVQHRAGRCGMTARKAIGTYCRERN
jgi:hypothetical protein